MMTIASMVTGVPARLLAGLAGGSALAALLVLGTPTPAAAQGYSTPRCPSGYTLEKHPSANSFRCAKKLSREYVHVGCQLGWIHQALSGRDTCKGLDTSTDPSKLVCQMSIGGAQLITAATGSGWQYEVMSGGDRCFRDRVEYAAPTF